MKHLRETFTNQEWKQLKQAKVVSQRNWHDFIMDLSTVGLQPKEVKTE